MDFYFSRDTWRWSPYDPVGNDRSLFPENNGARWNPVLRLLIVDRSTESNQFYIRKLVKVFKLKTNANITK